MQISIFGMGYVGCVSGACFAQMGHKVLGVEPNPVKVDLINSGKSPIVETGLDTLLAEVVQSGSFQATSDWSRAIKETDLALVCVGTPNRSMAASTFVTSNAYASRSVKVSLSVAIGLP